MWFESWEKLGGGGEGLSCSPVIGMSELLPKRNLNREIFIG